MDQLPDKNSLFQQKQLLLQKQHEEQQLMKQKQQSQQQLQQSQQLYLQQQVQQQSQQLQQQQTYYQQQQSLQVQPQSQQQQQQLVTKQQLLWPNQQGIREQRIMQQDHFIEQNMLLDCQQKQEQALREILELQDNNEDEDEPQEDCLLVQQQRPQLIQQQQQLHLQQQQRQQKEQQLQVFQQKQQQESQQQTQIVVQQPQIVQQTQIIQSQQPQFVQQTVQPQSQDVQQPLLVQKSQPQIVKKTQLVQQLTQQSQPVQYSQIVQQSQNIQQTQQNHQYSVSANQTIKQPPHSQQLLHQQLQHLLFNNKSLPQRIVVLGSQPQQQQLQQQPPRVVSANTTNQQHLLPQQVHCVVVTGTGQQQPQQRVIFTGNGHTQQQMQRIVVASTSQQQPQIQRYVVTNAGQQQQHVVIPTTNQQHPQQMQSHVTSSSIQQPQQMQRIVVSTVGPQQQQLQHVTSTSNPQQQQHPQQSGQRIVIGQIKSSQQTQQVQSPSQCGAVSQLQPKDIQHSITTKQQQKRLVISNQSQLTKPPQQQSPQQILLSQKLTQQLLQSKQQKLHQHVVAIHQPQSQELDQNLQQQQQLSQNLPLNIAVSKQQSQQQLHIQPLQTQLQLKQLNLQVQAQQHKQNHLKNEKHQEVMHSGLILGQLQHQLRPDPEKLKCQMQLQQFHRQKLQEHLLLQQQQQEQVQQIIKSNELKLQQKHHQQQLREQVLLQQHLRQQKQLQIRQQLLLKQQASSKNRISYVLSSEQKQKHQNDQNMIYQQTKLPLSEPLQCSERTPDTSLQDESDTNNHINYSPINTEEQLISLSSDDAIKTEEQLIPSSSDEELISSSSDDDECEDTTQNYRCQLIEAERLVWERYDALSMVLGPRYKMYYDEILENWLHGRLSREEFDRDIRKVLYVSWVVTITSKDHDRNSNDSSNLTDNSSKISSVIFPSSVDLKTTSNSSLKQEMTSTRSKSKQHAASLSKNIMNKNKETAINNKRKEAVFVLEKRIPLHNAFIASLVEWMPLNSQRLNRQAARDRGVTETGCPIRLYAYSDIPLSRGPVSHWYYEEPGSLTRWYWPDHLPFNSLTISTKGVKSSSNRSFLALEQKIATDAAIAAVSLKPPSRSLLPFLLRFAENKEALQAAQRKWCINMRLKKLMLKSKRMLPKQWSNGKRQLATMVRLQDGHTQLLRVLKAHNIKLNSHEHELMERLKRLKTRVALRRRKVLALFKIRQLELKARLRKYFDRSWQKLPEDQFQEDLLKEASIHIDDDSDDDTEYDDEEVEGQYIFLKQHLDRIRLLEEERGKQQHLKVINADTLQNQMRRDRRPPLTASTIQLLRDRQRIRACRRLLHTVKAERLQVSRGFDRVLELQHKLCPCGESNGRPCRYKNQMRRLLHKLQGHKLDEIDNQVQRTMAEELSEKEKVVFKESDKPAKTTLRKDEIKIREEKIAEEATLTKMTKVEKAGKKKATIIEKNVLNKKSEDLTKAVCNTSIEKSKTLKNAYKKKLKRLSKETKATTTGTRASPTFNDNKTVETVEKFNIGVSCELIHDKNSSQTSIYSSDSKQASLTTLGRRSTVDVAAAAARAVKAALAASRRTEHRKTYNKSINSTAKEYADREASELMPPPPPPPPPPPTKPSTTAKSPSVGARYLQQQQLLLDRHKQLERMRREERERRKRARFEHWRPKQENSDNFNKENNESLTMKMETDDSYSEFLQQEQKNMHEIQSRHGIDPEAEECSHNVSYEEMRRRNDYFYYYDGADYYSSDEEMSGSSLADPFPPLLHDLRIDQLPRPSNRIPAAALLPLGARTRHSSVPLIFSNYKDFESSANNEEHKVIESQKLTELNPEERSEEKQRKESVIIKKPSLPLSQNSFLTTRTSIEIKNITEPETSSIDIKSPTIEKKISKRLQSKLLEQQLSDDNITVNKLETFEQHQKKQIHKENEQSVMEKTSTTIERRSLRVSAKLPKTDNKFEAVSQEQKIDVKPKLGRVKRKRDLSQVELPLIESKSTSKQESKPSNSQPNEKEVDLPHQTKRLMELKSDVSQIQPKKKNVTFKQAHLIIPNNMDVKNSNSNFDQCKNSVLNSKQAVRFTVRHKKYEKTVIQKLLNEFGELIFILPPDQQLPFMCKLKQILQLPVLSVNQNKIPQSSLVFEVLHKLDVLLTNQQHLSLGEQKKKLSSLSLIGNKSKPKITKRLHSLLSQIKQQWEDFPEFALVKTAKSDEEISILAGNENTSKSDKDNKLLGLTSESADIRNSNDSDYVKKSIRPLIKQKQKFQRCGKKRVERDKIQCQRQSFQKVSQTKRLESQTLNEQNTTNSVQKKLHQHKRLQRIKILEKEKLLLEQQKLKLDQQKHLEQMYQERKNTFLEKLGDDRNIVKQQRSECLWTLVELPVSSKSYYNERLSLREQVIRKIFKNTNWQQLPEVEQTQSNMATIQKITQSSLESENENKLEMRKKNCRGSGYWWYKIGMQKKTSPLLIVNKRTNKRNKLKVDVPLIRHVQRTRPQTRKTAAVVVENHKKTIPTGLTIDEKNKLKQILKPQILKMVTEAEEKWLEQLQLQSVELDQQVNNHFKAMTEKQQQQVQLLLKNGKRLKKKYHLKCNLKTKLILSNPLGSVSKRWKQLETLRLKLQKLWKAKLSQLLEAKMTNKLFFRELYDRLMKLLTSSDQHHRQSDILSALKQLQHKPLNENERHNLHKLMELSKQKFMTQTLPKQVQNPQVLTNQNKLLQKPTLQNHSLQKIKQRQLKLTQTQKKQQSNLLKKTKKQELSPKPKQVGGKRNQNKQLQRKQKHKLEKQNQQPQKQRVSRKKVKHGRIIVRKRPKSSLAMKLRCLFQLRNRLINVQSRDKKPHQQQSMPTTEVGDIESKQQKQNITSKSILRKMTFLMYTQRIVLQRQLDRLNKWYPDTNDKRQNSLVLLAPQKITYSQNQGFVTPVKLQTLQPLSSEQIAKESTINLNSEQQQIAKEKRQILKQRLSGVQSILKPLMALWQLYLRFPKRWLHHQLNNIEKIRRKQLLVKSVVNNNSSNICLQKSLQRHNKEPEDTAAGYRTQQMCQQIQRIREHLNWRRQQVYKLLVELSMAMRKEKHLILSTPESHRSSIYPVSLRLGKPSTSKYIFSKYSALLRLQRSSTLNKQNLSYSLLLKLQRSFLPTEISSNYSALLKLHKSSIRSALSTPLESSNSKHQFSVSLTPLQSFSINQNSSNISTILNSLAQSSLKQQSSISTLSSLCDSSKQLNNNLNSNQLFQNKIRFSDINKSENYDGKITSESTKKPKLPSLPNNSKRARCLSSVTHPKTKISVNNINVKEKQTSTIIISDSDDETETLKISTDKSTNLVKPNLIKENVYNGPEIGCSSVIISDSDEEIKIAVGTSSQISKKSKLTGNLISAKSFTEKNTNITSDDNDPNVIYILDSDEETEALGFKLLPIIREPIQMSEKSNLTNVRTLLSESVTNFRDSETNDDINKSNNCLKKNVQQIDQHCVNDHEIPKSTINTSILSNLKKIKNTVYRPKKINIPMQSNSSKPIKVAIIECIHTTMATSKKPLNLKSQCDKPLKLVATLNNKVKTVDVNFLMEIIKKLTEIAVSVARRTPMSTVQKENSIIVFNQTPVNVSLSKQIMKNSSNKFYYSSNLNSSKNTERKSDAKIPYFQPCDNVIPEQILRKCRRLIRTVTIDTCGPTVPKFCDHGFLDDTIEKAIHGRFVSTIMAMAAANLITSFVPPQQPRLPIECIIAKRHGHVPTVSDIDDNKSDKSDINDNKVTTSTNTPVQLSSIMDLLEKADKASVETGCSTVHIWSGSARTSGSLLVFAIKSAKERVAALRAQYMSQLETTVPFVSTSRQSRTTVTKAEDIVSKPMLTVTTPIYKRSVSATTAVTSTKRNKCNRSEALKRSASVAFLETPEALSAVEDQRSKPFVTIADIDEKEHQILAPRSFKRSAAVAFSPELPLSPKGLTKSIIVDVPADSSTKSTTILSPTVLRKSKRSKSTAITSTPVLESTPSVVTPYKRSKSTSSTTIASTVTGSLTPVVVLPNSTVKDTKRSKTISTTNTFSSVCSSTSVEPVSTPEVEHPNRSTILLKSASSSFAPLVKPLKMFKSVGSIKNASAKNTTTKTCVTPTVSVTHKHDMTPKILEAKAFVAPINNVVDQEKMAGPDVTTQNGPVVKTKEITKEETRIVTVTRTRCLTVPALMDVTADACSLVVSACEQFVRAMVVERLTKAGRGFGTMELRRRDAFAAAMAFDETIRPTPEYCSTSKLAVTTAEISNSPAADNVSNWLDYKLLRPAPSVDDQPERARLIPTFVFDDQSNSSSVLTIKTVVETQTTTTTTTTITAVNEQLPTTSVYTVKPIPSSVAPAMSDTSARTRGAELLKFTVAKKKTVVDDGQRPETIATTRYTDDKLFSANPTLRAPVIAESSAVVVPDSTTEVVVNNRTPPITVTDCPVSKTDERLISKANRGFFVERGRPLLRPAFHRRQPFGTLVATSVMAALETTAENDAARKCVSVEKEKELEQKQDEKEDDGGGGGEWSCYFGDSDCLPPASRLNIFLAADRTSTPTEAGCLRASSSGDADDPSLVRQRKRLIEEIVRRQRCRDRLTREVERRMLEQRDRPPDTLEEHYQKFLRLQYGSKDATPGSPKTPLCLPNGVGTRRGIVSWY